jgi:hypothetical protein
MTEIIARIGQSGNVELVDERMVSIAGAAPMTPADAAFLARSLLSCAALVTLNESPRIGTLCADLHFPVLKWTIAVQAETRSPVVIFSVPPGIDLTFQMTPQIEKELGAALVAHAERLPPPQRAPDQLH